MSLKFPRHSATGIWKGCHTICREWCFMVCQTMLCRTQCCTLPHSGSSASTSQQCCSTPTLQANSDHSAPTSLVWLYLPTYLYKWCQCMCTHLRAAMDFLTQNARSACHLWALHTYCTYMYVHTYVGQLYFSDHVGPDWTPPGLVRQHRT